MSASPPPHHQEPSGSSSHHHQQAPPPSKRGRKRDDNLPPNRARDVQRAFRARRASHLESLEARVVLLEEENARFRVLLDLPPSERPPLGTGPTGRGKLTCYLSPPPGALADIPSMAANGGRESRWWRIRFDQFVTAAQSSGILSRSPAHFLILRLP